MRRRHSTLIAIVLLRRQPEGAAPGSQRGHAYNQPAMPSPADPELFREVFGRFATGVAVITSSGPTGQGGMTANAICSLSLDPLLALVCFENQARTLPIVREAGRFAVNVLSAGQEDLAAVFASKLPEAEKLDGVDHRLRARAADHRRLAGVGGVRAEGADFGRRPYDRDRRGARHGPRRRRAAAVVRGPVPRLEIWT